MKFQKITVCLDMYGCPNRCRHCWLGVTPNGNLKVGDLTDVARAFRPFTGNLEVVDRYREEDFGDNYRDLWQIRAALSDTRTPHFENISCWRAARDLSYVPWLASLGVKAAQLTIFGDEAATDYYVGRRGAFKEILRTIEQLLRHGISPRLQTFIYKSNLDQLTYIRDLIAELDLELRCSAVGGQFAFFLHQGTCDGENEQFYDVWITPEDIDRIPPQLIARTLKHFGADDMRDVLGEPEDRLCEQIAADTATKSIVTDSPVFHVDKDFNVYPNYETPSPIWCLGNLKTLGAERILANYVENRSPGQSVMNTVPLRDIGAAAGNPDSRRLFLRDDYERYLVNKYCRLMRQQELNP